MSSPASIGIFYLSFGSGHERAALAIQEAVERLRPDWTVHVIDPFVDRWAGTETVMEALSALTALSARDVYETAWRTGKGMSTLRSVLRVPVFRALMKPLVDEYGKDAVVCTHAFPCAILALDRIATHTNPVLMGVLTDFAPNAVWPTMGVDAYVVPNQPSRSALVSRGVPEDRVHVAGIPIDPAFTTRPDRAALRRELGLPDGRKVVLVMAGSRRSGPYAATVPVVVEFARSGAQYPPDVHVVIVAGGNRSLEKRLQDISRETGVRLEVLGFVDRMMDYLTAADVVVTKPGGLIVSEALACATPIVMLTPGPGQERANAEFLLQEGAALPANDCEELLGALSKVLGTSGHRENLITASRRLGRPEAALDTARLLETLLSRRGDGGVSVASRA